MPHCNRAWQTWGSESDPPSLISPEFLLVFWIHNFGYRSVVWYISRMPINRFHGIKLLAIGYRKVFVYLGHLVFASEKKHPFRSWHPFCDKYRSRDTITRVRSSYRTLPLSSFLEEYRQDSARYWWRHLSSSIHEHRGRSGTASHQVGDDKRQAGNTDTVQSNHLNSAGEVAPRFTSAPLDDLQE